MGTSSICSEIAVVSILRAAETIANGAHVILHQSPCLRRFARRLLLHRPVQKNTNETRLISTRIHIAYDIYYKVRWYGDGA
jgi:hypothetical protein